MKKFTALLAISLFTLSLQSTAQKLDLNAFFKKGLTCDRLPHLMQFMASKHYSIRKIDNTLRERTIKEYINFLDGSKTLLLLSDVKKVKNIMRKMFKTMKNSDCAALDQVKQIALDRSKENENFMRSFMGKDYKFDESIKLVTDPEKRQYAKNSAEKNELLKKFAHFQISNYLLNETPLEEAKGLLVHRYELVTKRIAEKDDQNQFSELLKAFATAFDPHTSYFSMEDFEDFQINMKLSLEGIGASLSSQDGFTVVEEVITGGAADRAGVLERKDKIISVSQVGKKNEKAVSVVDMDLKDVVRLIRGKKGSKVKLTILRKSGSETKRMEVVIVRDKIDLTDSAAKLKMEKRVVDGKTYNLAVIDLPSFYGALEKGKRSSYDDMKDLLAKANKSKADGLLLNLRQNGGGLLEGARSISGLFINKGPIVATKDTEGNVRQLIDEDESISFSKPMVILISRASASAAEILPGALLDYDRAVLVGADRTFGKGSVQQVEPFANDMGAVKITTALYFLPKGESTQHQGVRSHINLPSVLQSEKIGENTLDYSLPPQKIKSFAGKEYNLNKGKQSYIPITDDIVKKLAANSKKRVESDKKFDEIRKEIIESKKNDGMVVLSDFRKKAAEDKKDEDKTLAERKKDMNEPYINEGLNVLVDLVDEVQKKEKVVAGQTR